MVNLFDLGFRFMKIEGARKLDKGRF